MARYGDNAHQFEFAIRGTADATNVGRLSFRWSVTGATYVFSRFSTSAISFTNSPLWVRVTLVMATGVSTFYTSTDGFTWTNAGAGAVTGATGMFDSDRIIEIGGYGWSSSTAQFKGRIYEVRVRNGILGPLVAPAIPDRWQRYPHNSGETTVTFGGAQTLYIINGSRGGQGITYLSDATRFPKMTPDYGQLLHIYNSSKNETNLAQEGLLAKWNAWHSLVQARLPLATEMVLTQNPNLAASGGNWIREQILRPHQLQAWAQRLGLGYVDTSLAFAQDPRGLAALMKDGVHPSDTDGQQLWTDVLDPYVFGASTPTTTQPT